MNAPLFYRPGSKWQTALAFTSAVLIHVGAVALAELRPEQTPIAPPGADDAWVIIETIEDAQPPPTAQEEDPPIAPPPPESATEFFDEAKPTPPPRRQAKTASPFARAPTNAAPRGPAGPARAFALSAPRPEYPYEARRERLTGSGVATLTIDRASGTVINVTMARSTGSAVLDNATISGLRRWRFKPGTISPVQTPITYTLTGASY